MAATTWALVFGIALLVSEASAACDAQGNMLKLAACQQAATAHAKNPNTLAGCCDAVRAFGGSKDKADCLCKSLVAAQKINKAVDLHIAVKIPAACGVSVLPNLKCQGIPIPQH